MAAALALALACGGPRGESPDEAAEGTAAADSLLPDQGEGALLGPVPNGSPMLPAEQAGGVPPYPGAVVWMRAERNPSEFDAVEAFTADSYPRVVAFYDSALSGWKRSQFADAVTYELESDSSAVSVFPWDGAEVPEAAPAVLKDAHAAIGAAWKKQQP